MNCTRWNRHGMPCPAPGLYEVLMPSPTTLAGYGVQCCKRHLAEVVDDAWAEIVPLVEAGLFGSGAAVEVIRVPDAPRLPSLLERIERR